MDNQENVTSERESQQRGRPVLRRLMLIMAGVIGGVAVMLGLATAAQAHGTADSPASRLWQCRYNFAPGGTNAMCNGAWTNTSSTNMLYDWNGNNNLTAGGNTEATVPDGKICSGGSSKFAYLDTPGAWPVTNIKPGADGLYSMHFNITAPHATSYYRVYLTNQGFDPTKSAPKWSDMTKVYQSGASAATSSYDMKFALPARTGTQILYVIWQRSDSQEAFYSCSDVTINGSGSTASPSASPTATASATPSASATPTKTPTATPTASPTVTPSVTPSASATPTASTGTAAINWKLTITSNWGSGFCADGKVTTPSATAVPWTASIPFKGTVTSLWNASYKTSGGVLKVTPPTWGPTISASTPATFGFCASGTPPALSGSSNVTVTSSPSATPTPTTASPTPTTASPTPTQTTASPSPTTASPTPTQTQPGTLPVFPTGKAMAPYVDVAAWPTPDLNAMMQATGVKYYSLAFINSSSGCTPAWGGVLPLDPSNAATSGQLAAIDNGVKAVRAAGGDVIISFGGASGSELAATCTNQAQLKAAYKKVIDYYSATRLDFDVEGAAVADQATNLRRAQALAGVVADYKAAGRNIQVDLTLPVLPSGLDANGLATFKSTVQGGVLPHIVNVMAMDYGSPDSQMGQHAIDAGVNTGKQIAYAYGNPTGKALYAHVGITPMIGQNDSAGEVFSLADTKTLTDWTNANGVGLVSYWSMNRDTPCASPLYACSGTTSVAKWSYSKAFVAKN